ncbi:guanine nucleotide-binding protein G(I)/G(S)/G(O) subunit gamma-10-like [Lepus europaeus]|uniref:guanine nucleotide-binding protein G(I)/G(S)/G(O) subunit gamma-10-like n=2 Tax=Lagomorpha TaxID=9975 RepID=UPI002B4948BC|nr:guanine nucleotide-binding protein G(I)/G(S)/G(O) subunit gamma-10-like [Lepus europaeus]
MDKTSSLDKLTSLLSCIKTVLLALPPLEPSAAAMSSGASVSALQRVVEQLKLEAGVERIKVSQAAAELQQYCMQNACKDALLVGVPAGSNPFREPRSCALL